MKLLFKSLALAAFLVAISAPSLASAQNVQNFSFKSFDADYSLSQASDKSSQLNVTETLVAEFPSFNQNHGILRALPERYKNHSLGLKVASVNDLTGNSYRYTTSHQNDNLVLKIGDPNSYVTGEKIYVISYSYRDVVSFYDDHDEFYWDINGDQWAQVFGQVKVKLHLPAAISKNLVDKQYCYKGYFGQRSADCSIVSEPERDGSVLTATAVNLQPNTTLTILAGFKKGTFVLSPTAKRDQQLQKADVVGAAAAVVLVPLAALFYLIGRWRSYGNDPKGRGVIVPQYEPPKDLDLFETNFIENEQVSPQAMTAQIIQLAVKGILAIYEVPKQGLFGSKDYEVEIKSLPADLTSNEKWVLDLLFDGFNVGDRVSMKDFKKSAKDNYKKWSAKNKSTSAELTAKGYFQRDPKKLITKFGTVSGILIALSVGAIYLLGSTNSRIYVFYGLAFGLGLAALMTLIFSTFITALTDKGVEAKEYLKGLRDYIKMAEQDRLSYLQSPEGAQRVSDPSRFNPAASDQKVKLYESLLPYAVLFGQEKQWSKKFDGVYTSSPSWYYGTWGTFNTGSLGDSIGGFGQTFATSGAAGGSGFAGGGAGGGGGGGGGGGW